MPAGLAGRLGEAAAERTKSRRIAPWVMRVAAVLVETVAVVAEVVIAEAVVEVEAVVVVAAVVVIAEAAAVVGTVAGEAVGMTEIEIAIKEF